MSNWKLITKTYLYDGTWNGFLTIVFNCFETKTLPQKIGEQNTYISNFLDSLLFIQTDEEKAKRVLSGMEKVIGYQSVYYCYYAFLCSKQDKETTILKYICNGFEIGPSIQNMLSVSYVFDTIRMQRRSFGECHRLKGLLRFQDLGNNLFYASIHPDNYILEPLGHHFIKRLSSQNFIIHDKIRNLCFLYNGKTYQIVDSNNMKIPDISEEEKLYQELWKMFFKTIAIKERTNPRCQMQFMPKKYWQDLIEEP